MPSIVKKDPWWLADPHRKAYTEQAVLGPTSPQFWAYNPAWAEVQNQHVWGAAWADVIQHGMTPEAAADKAFKWTQSIFAKYPIAQT
jgi:ABC-type glycerol-3-phosphate transport system substrate-binding protein